MRLYEIVIDGGPTYTSRNNPNALQVELDIDTADATNVISGTVVIWGIALEDISQSSNLKDKSITIIGGMQPGLPLRRFNTGSHFFQF